MIQKLLIIFLLFIPSLQAETKVKVGLGAILTGEIAVFGQSDLKAANLYLKHFKRHPIKLIPEDAKLNSKDGLSAYNKLINIDKVEVLIAAGSSNGIIAAKNIVEKTETPTMMASTGGSNIDNASQWIFRTGNSDVLNGTQQAEEMIKDGHKRIALITEQTEYTMDIAEHFKTKFKELGGSLSADNEFTPGDTDFRTMIYRALQAQPDAIFMPTQAGTVLGVFLKQLRQINEEITVYTTMVAAPNTDAHRIAGELILGVKYMAPVYGEDEKYTRFEKLYIKEYGEPPAVPFHNAAVLDALEHIQNFLDVNQDFDAVKFREYLTTSVKDYCGYMGCYSLDAHGHSNLGFKPAVITEVIN